MSTVESLETLLTEMRVTVKCTEMICYLDKVLSFCHILQNIYGSVVLPFVLSGCETRLNPRVDSISEHSLKTIITP